MKRCYELFILQESVRESNGRISSSRLFTEIHPDAEDKIEELLQKHGRNCWEFFGNCDVTFRRENIWPWSIVLFDDEFRLAGHVVSIRRNRKDFSFSAYSIKPGEYSLSKDSIPPVSVLFINNKDSLQELASRSELFKMAWNQLSNCPEQQHWICIAEPPSPEWIDNISQNDDQLFMKITSS